MLKKEEEEKADVALEGSKDDGCSRWKTSVQVDYLQETLHFYRQTIRAVIKMCLFVRLNILVLFGEWQLFSSIFLVMRTETNINLDFERTWSMSWK